MSRLFKQGYYCFYCFSLLIGLLFSLYADVIRAEGQGAYGSGFISLGTGAGAINPFTSSESISNDVSMFTGDVQFGLKLISLKGPNDFGVEVGLSYSSNIEHIANSDNNANQASWVGLGWSLEFPSIAVNLNGTVDYLDDEYYYVDPSEGRIKLIPTDVENEYIFEDYKYWKITRIIGTDPIDIDYVSNWKITKEDGTEYYFGDKISQPRASGWEPSASRLTIGRDNCIIDIYTTKWDHSVLVPSILDQPQYVIYQWDLSSIKNSTNDDEISISYEQQRVPGYHYVWDPPEGYMHWNFYYTRWSHPSSITGPTGKSVEFFTSERDDGEFLVKKDKINSVRCDSVYLDSIILVGCNQCIASKIEFNYDVVKKNTNYDYDKKRFLKEIIQYTPDGKAPPSIEFEYYTDSQNDIHYGALESVLSPYGSLVKYEYKSQKIKYSPTKYAGEACSSRVDITNGLATRYAYDAYPGGCDVKGVYSYYWNGRWEVDSLRCDESDDCAKHIKPGLDSYAFTRTFFDAGSGDDYMDSLEIRVAERVNDKWVETIVDTVVSSHSAGNIYASRVDAYLLQTFDYTNDHSALLGISKCGGEWKLESDTLVKNLHDGVIIHSGKDYYVVIDSVANVNDVATIKWNKIAEEPYWHVVDPLFHYYQQDDVYSSETNNVFKLSEDYFAFSVCSGENGAQGGDWFRKVSAYIWRDTEWYQWDHQNISGGGYLEFDFEDSDGKVYISTEKNWFAVGTNVDYEMVSPRHDIYTVHWDYDYYKSHAVSHPGESNDDSLWATAYTNVVEREADSASFSLTTGQDYLAYWWPDNKIHVHEWSDTGWASCDLPSHTISPETYLRRLYGRDDYFIMYFEDEDTVGRACLFYESHHSDGDYDWLKYDPFYSSAWSSSGRSGAFRLGNQSYGYFSNLERKLDFAFFTKGYEVPNGTGIPSHDYDDLFYKKLVIFDIAGNSDVGVPSFFNADQFLYYWVYSTTHDTLQFIGTRDLVNDVFVDTLIDYPVESKKVLSINIPDADDSLFSEWTYEFIDGIADKSGYSTKYHKAIENYPDTNGYIAHYFYNDLFYHEFGSAFPGTTGLGDYRMLDGVEYKTEVVGASILSRTTNYYVCDTLPQIDHDDYPAVYTIRMDSTRKMLDGTESVTAYMYSDSNGMVSEINEYFGYRNGSLQTRKTRINQYTADTSGVPFDSMKARNMLSPLVKSDVFYGQATSFYQDTLRMSRNFWDKYNLGGQSYYLLTRTEDWQGGDEWIVTGDPVGFNEYGNTIQSIDNQELPTAVIYDRAGLSPIGVFKNAWYYDVFFSTFVTYCSSFCLRGEYGIDDAWNTSHFGNMEFFDNPPWAKDWEYDWEDDPPDDGLYVHGDSGDVIDADLTEEWEKQWMDGDAGGMDPDTMYRDQTYILRFDYRIESGAIRVRAGWPGDEYPISWVSPGESDGLWHTAFLEGTWTPEMDFKIKVEIMIMCDNTYFWIDNLAFFPKNCQATTQKFNHNKGLPLTTTNNNGYSLRKKYNSSNHIAATTNVGREYISSSESYLSREMELDATYSDFDEHPNFNLNTSFPFGNAVLNGGFEHGLWKWSDISDTTAKAYFENIIYYDQRQDFCDNCDDPVMGAKTCRLETADDSIYVYQLLQKIPIGSINSANDYTLSYYAWRNRTSTSYAKVRIQWFDKMCRNLDVDDFQFGGIDTSPEQYIVTFTPPAGARGAYLSIIVEQYGKNFGDVYFFDQIALTESDELIPGIKTVTYSDGLGNELQSLTPYDSLVNVDIITATEYDGLFRPIKKYKTYETARWDTSSNKPHQYDYEYDLHAKEHYSDSLAGPDCGGYPYTESHYYADPLGRLDTLYQPGADFRSHPTVFYYGYNYFAKTGILNTYPAGTLSKHKVIDENGLRTITWKNTLGHLIETTVDSSTAAGHLHLTTQYGPNVMGEVIKIMPPLAVDSSIYALRIYKDYDKLGNVIADSSSDKGRTRYVYDSMGMLRFTQNSKQRSENKWTETQYDILGRKLLQGEIAVGDTSTPDPDIDVLSFNTSGGTVLRYQYDFYDTLSIYKAPENFSIITTLDLDTLRARGKVVATDNGVNPDDGVKKSFTYDCENNLICAGTLIQGLDTDWKELHLNYDKAGKLIREDYPYAVGGNAPLLKLKFDYNDFAKLAQISRITPQSDTLKLARYKYFCDGSIKECLLGDTTQKIDYYYNERGWLAEINGSDPLDGGVLTPDADDKFCMRLGFNNFDEEIGGEDGSLEAMYNGVPTWAVQHYNLTAGSDTLGYTFHYDNANRLTKAKYSEIVDGNWSLDEELDGMEFQYDRNSNIMVQIRDLIDTTGYDTLVYHYHTSPRSNKLDYIEPIQNTANYEYDDIGNCTADTSRNKSEYIFDWRNKLIESSWDSEYEKSLEFLYDPSGKRVKKTLTDVCSCEEDFNYPGSPHVSCIHPSDSSCTAPCSDGCCGDIVPGDVNGYNGCNGADVTRLVCYFEGTDPACTLATNKMQADANCDGLITGGDVTKLVLYFRGLTDLYCCYWVDTHENNTFYLHSKGNEVVEYFDDEVSVQNVCYVYGPTGKIAVFPDSSGPYYYLTDHLGSVRMVVDEDKTPLSYFYYLPSGDLSKNKDHVEGVETPYKFSGKELDDEGDFGLYYFGSRYFDPLACRWRQLDPAGQFASPYSYVGGNLYASVDPNGEFAIIPVLTWALYNGLSQQGGLDKKAFAFGTSFAQAAIGGPGFFINHQVSRVASELFGGGANGKIFDYISTAANVAAIGIAGYNLLGKGLNQFGVQSFKLPVVGTIGTKINLGNSLSAAVTMRIGAIFGNPIGPIIKESSFKTVFSNMKNKWTPGTHIKRACDFNLPRHEKSGTKYDKFDAFNFFEHALGAYLYYNIASGGARGDIGAHSQAMFDYYTMFEWTFEHTEDWSTQDYAADLTGASFGYYLGCPDWINRKVDWLF
ncbi:MAG: hypothetical protein GY839_12825 [candidate division Zixibacteria bacterium]|nr:hypothetical protein [candidate division Zixibacteria bacterium]